MTDFDDCHGRVYIRAKGKMWHIEAGTGGKTACGRQIVVEEESLVPRDNVCFKCMGRTNASAS